jgi:hypothetical protein
MKADKKAERGFLAFALALALDKEMRMIAINCIPDSFDMLSENYNLQSVGRYYQRGAVG